MSINKKKIYRVVFIKEDGSLKSMSHLRKSSVFSIIHMYNILPHAIKVFEMRSDCPDRHVFLEKLNASD